ncbi:cbb3-type cytochrome c oxidase N-terminal domain-containing protein [Pinibacter soli]|uniref:Cbb3-type cytochrome c oxidase N-terminal domain-containing protein n=1 Tax=Pinibacter soli TaxID=3044211 RepID=A0ABT6RDX1_9BACT|nr:cbb3-type cytochrome c oxidase N-terminal domain-containing protein [Pinibacter soli]MDI3320757.1 cbb3-type cytochrome c oxidase N-terminal domain-containing protein [Pinibacter soli]
MSIIKTKNFTFKKILFLLPGLVALVPSNAWALGATDTPATQESSMSNPLAIWLTVVMGILLLIIALLAYVVRSGMDVYRAKNIVPKNSTAIYVILFLVAGGLSVSSAHAETTEVSATHAASTIAGLSPVAFYLMIGVIIAELLVIFALIYNLKVLLGLEKNRIEKEQLLEAQGANSLSWWERFNGFKHASEEGAIVLDHDYDGIRELDNKLPRWWVWLFYLTIFGGVIYMYRFHIGKTAPLSGEEYAMEVKQAAIEQEEYLKKSANRIDETNAKLLTAESDLAAGKAVFATVCKNCHGEKGEGAFAPNLTDDYWLHGGDIKSVFKTIKYGVDGKGMNSWKDTYSPLQMEQIASYIKSLHGTNPPNAKPPQGDKYVEGIAATTTAATDSAQTAK